MTALILTSIEAFLAVLCLLVGIPILFNPEALAPGSVLTLLPGWSIYPWGVCITLGGAVGLLGIMFSEYRLERIGVLLLGASMGVYSFALVGALPASFVGLLTFAFFSLAMSARYWVLGKLVKIQQMRIDLMREENQIDRGD